MTRLLLFLIVGILTYPLCAQQSKPIGFVHIGLEEGLSQSTVFDITQDKKGTMWFATNNGLNKFDGYNFTVYQNDEQNPHSIGCDVTRTCITDKLGKIWVGTDEGLALYDAAKENFHNFAFQKNGKNLPIKDIVEISDTKLLLLSDKKLLQFDTDARLFSENSLSPALMHVVPTAIYRAGDYIYIGSKEGLYAYSISQNTLRSLLPEQLQEKEILSILQQSSTRLWIGTEGDGLFLMNPQTETMVNYMHTPGKINSISSNYVRSLALDSQNRLWIGTIHSLNIYNENSDAFDVYASDSQESGSLSQPSVRTIFADAQGGMWLGTYLGGLNYYHPLKNRFQHMQSITSRNSLNSNIVGCIREDSKGDLWIGTNGGGVNYYHTDAQAFTHYTQAEGLGANDVKAIYVDDAHNLVYIGTHKGGLNILQRNSGRIETLKQKNITNIYAIEPTLNGELWLSGTREILRFNPLNKTFTPITTQTNGQPIRQNWITNLMRDSKHRLWAGGEKGLVVYTEKENQLSESQLIPAQSPLFHKFINCVHEARNGVFWIGTRSGIYSFDEKKQVVKQYTTAHGLPNNVVHGILEDSYGKLWISTEKGLSYFQPATEKFRNYTSNDGLPSNQFTLNSYCRTTDEQMYFGSIKGITTFHPEQLADNPYTPLVDITELRLFNQIVRPDDETGILQSAINETKRITLSASQSMFSLQFVVSNYISGNHNTFAYKLDGYDKAWYYTSNVRTASYSNLPGGTYRFLVKAANSDGKWNDTPTTLEIVILPVWYRTWWAYLLFIVALIGIAYFVFRHLWIRKSMQAQIELERIDKERQREVNEMKLRFFINISHELRTPLTLILAPAQEMLDKVSDRWMRKQLETIQRSTNRLLHLVNQLMDYRRAELGVFGLQVKRNDIHRVIEKNFLFYERLAQRKEIKYNLYSELESKETLCDPNYLELIVNNLLSNAFKYTGDGQSIIVTLKEESNRLLLQVKDTGNGIPIDKQSRIFERFYQVESEHIGSGIGLSLVQRLVELHHGHIELDSAEGKGSTFSIYLPTNEDAYQPDEKASGTSTECVEAAHSTNSREMYILDTEQPEERANEEETTEDVASKTSIQPQETILVVEDNADIRQYLSEELRKNYRILEAENGEKALELVKEQEVSLILTDVMMPVMDGLQLCKQIKQNLNTCHIPVIILSAKAELNEQLEGLQVGADDYIPKPFSMTLVTTKIKNLFRTRHRVIQYYSNSLEIEPEKIALNPMDEVLLKKAVDIVEKHIDHVEFSTDEFAREMLMSRSNLHLKLKALTGEATNEFIRKIRFSKACKLLKEERYTVSEISSMVGFNTPSYFATSFKKYFGCLPSEYVRNRNNQHE